jgi:hypothetical protein
MKEWIKITPEATSPEGAIVETKIDDTLGVRNVTRLRRQGSLFYFPDGGMYVYYVPTHWREISAAELAKDPIIITLQITRSQQMAIATMIAEYELHAADTQPNRPLPVEFVDCSVDPPVTTRLEDLLPLFMGGAVGERPKTHGKVQDARKEGEGEEGAPPPAKDEARQR